MRIALTSAIVVLSAVSVASPQNRAEDRLGSAAPLVIGETFTIASKVLVETRRINVYMPPGHADAPHTPVPVLYMPDGGMGEKGIVDPALLAFRALFQPAVTK